MKGKKIELTAQERELLMLDSSEEEAVQQDPNEVLMQRRKRDEKELKKNGLLPQEPEQNAKTLRTRRVKSKNFHEDYVYDDKTLKDTIALKNTNASQVPEQKASTLKAQTKKTAKKPVGKQSVKAVVQEPEVKKENGKRLYCLCKTEDESQNMICCDKCQEWYHFECVGLDIVRNKIIFRPLFQTSTISTMSAPSARRNL